MDIINQKENSIPTLKKKCKQLKQLLKIKLPIEQRLDIIDDIKEIKESIREIRKLRTNYHFEHFHEYCQVNEPIEEISFNSFIGTDNNTSCKCLNIGLIDSILSCHDCGKISIHLVESSDFCEITTFAYKRIDHLKEILSQLQAKETNIPDDIIETIQTHIKHDKVTTLTPKYIKTILRTIKQTKYNDHYPAILTYFGVKPLFLERDIEEQILKMFIAIQAPFSKYRPSEQSNFLNYYYVIRKLCEILKQPHVFDFLPIINNRIKRIEQDALWKLICNDLNWEFIESS